MGHDEESERMPLLHSESGNTGRRRFSKSITHICLMIFGVGCVAATTAISLSFYLSEQSSNTTTTSATTTTPGRQPRTHPVLFLNIQPHCYQLRRLSPSLSSLSWSGAVRDLSEWRTRNGGWLLLETSLLGILTMTFFSSMM